MRAAAANERVLALAVALSLGTVWMAVGPKTADLAAQVYRVGLFSREGFAVWDNAWFGGHHLPGYSVLFPPLGSLVGARAAGFLAVAVSAVLFADLMRRLYGPRPYPAVAWFAVVAAGDLFIGRLTFALGVTAALACLAALSRDRYWLAMVFAVATPAASPVAGVFLGLVLVIAWPRLRARQRVYLLASLGAAVAAMALVFPDGGQQPYDLASAAAALAIVVAVGVQLAPSEVLLRRAAALYTAAIAASYFVPTPMGSNVARLGVLFAGPLFIASRRRSSRAVMVLTCAAIGLWQAWGPITEVSKASLTDANKSAYFAPLLGELDRVGARDGRVEVVPTTTRWESVYVARRFAMARGWETQLDRSYNPLFYRETLPAAAYRGWLQRNSVRFVAVPDAPTERWGKTEARLIAAAPGFLVPVWHDAHWRLFRVRGARGLAGAGRKVTLRPDGFAVTTRRPGAVTVRVRWSEYWTVLPGGCVRRTPDGVTQVLAPRAGTYVVRARWSLDAALDGGGSCSPRGARR